jgi:hypothetical protein
MGLHFRPFVTITLPVLIYFFITTFTSKSCIANNVKGTNYKLLDEEY